ncbi:type II toxin-antitoxin system VapC family toxin [Candidatus Parcubacteria bacterium]|nr:type II toxin-antitoxin system VapC family toxin [Candidatus Parcubacteria bacterium]
MPLTIDTNILIYHLERDQQVSKTLEQWLLDGERLFVSAITRLELFAAPILRENEEKKIYRLLEQFVLVPVDAQMADIAALVRRRYGLQLGDSIIAATALLTNSSLVTRNVRDFKKIAELNILTL